MFQLLFTISPLLLALSVDSQDTKDPNTKAASSFTNCGCQCSNLAFKDNYFKIHGNCKSTDQTGAQWCYVDPKQYSSCQDLSYNSARFPGTPWSYEACATPACANNGGFNNGGFNNGGFNNGEFNNGGVNNGGFNNGGFSNGYNSGTGSSICRGAKCGTGSTGYNTGAGSNGFNNGLAGILAGRSKTEQADDSVKFGR